MLGQLPYFALIEVSGEDRHSFLHNQLSNDIQNLAPNQACYATYNTAKGRVIANLIAYNAGETIWLMLAKDVAEIVVKRLKMFVLRAKVSININSEWGVSGSLKEDAQPIYPIEPQLILSSDAAGNIVLPHKGSLKIAPLDQLPTYDKQAEKRWQAHELASGYPWISAATSETCVAQMLNQHIIGGIHFRKGCYPGQEIIARAQYRGQVKRGLAIAQSDAYQAIGSLVYDEQKNEVALIINAVDDLKLLVTKFSAIASPLQDESGNAMVLQHLFFDVP